MKYIVCNDTGITKIVICFSDLLCYLDNELLTYVEENDFIDLFDIKYKNYQVLLV
jgi:hypothetical protein